MKLHLLTSMSAAALNGSTGVVQGYDESNERYVVKIDESGERLALRADKLLQLVSRARMVSLESRQDLNGKTADVMDWDASAERYTVQVFSTGEQVALRPANLVVGPGTCVTVVGLQSATEHNGEHATVESYDQAAGRYVLELRSGQKLRVRPGNVRV